MDKIIENIEKGIANGKAKALANSKLNGGLVATAIIKKGARVCFEPETGKEVVIASDMEVKVDSWNINLGQGIVFNNRTAYCNDMDKLESK